MATSTTASTHAEIPSSPRSQAETLNRCSSTISCSRTLRRTRASAFVRSRSLPSVSHRPTSTSLLSFRQDACADVGKPDRYDPGTDQYDSSPKRRIPAWCDRILWRADRSEHVTPLHYQRYEVNISDHKPVSAAFDCRVKRIDSTKRAAVWQEVESAWFSVESSILDSARQYYREKE